MDKRKKDKPHYTGLNEEMKKLLTIFSTTIVMGVNDWAAARNNASEGVYYHLGDINSRETNTIRGAMRMWCDKIQELRNTESCANTKFYFMTPTITSWNSSVTKTRDWDQSKTNVHGFTLRDMCHAIIDVATE